METQPEDFKITNKININFISKKPNEGKYFQKIAVSKNHLIIKDKNLLIIEKDPESNFKEIASFETKEILNIFSLPNNSIYYLEPNEIKKLDLNELTQQPKKIVFVDSNNNTLEPSNLHIDHVRLKIPGMEDTICSLFQTAYNQLYFSIKKETKEDKNSNNQNIIHNAIFLKNLKNNYDFVRSLFFKVYRDEKENFFLCIYILCDQIGYFYRIDLTSEKENPEDAKNKIEDFFENENESSYSVIYRFEDKFINFFHCFELDNLDKKPIRLLVGDENFLFRLINLEDFYLEENNLFLNDNNLISPNYISRKIGKKISDFPSEKYFNKLNEFEQKQSSPDFINEEDFAIDLNEEDERNKSFASETDKFNNNEGKLLFNDKNLNNFKNLNQGFEINNSNKEFLIYLNELVLSYHNINKMQVGGTNFSLNAKLVPEEFNNCFIKQGKIFFFFRNFIYCYNIDNNNISYGYNSRDIIKDVCFCEEIEEDKKNYHKSYILNNIHVSILKFQIEEINNFSELHIENDIDDAVKIRNFIREQKLCEWCYKPASKRCSGCRLSHYCSIEHQSLDWERHRDYCDYNEKNIANFSMLTEEFELFLSKQRMEILQYFKNRGPKNLKKGIDLNFQLTEVTLKLLRERYDIVQKYSNGGFLKQKQEIANFIELNKFIAEHVTNVFLLVYGFLINNKNKEAYRILGIIRREVEDDEVYQKFFAYIPILYRNILVQDGVLEYEFQAEEKIKIYNFQKTDSIYKLEIFDLLLTYLDLNSTAGKVYYIMGELAMFEKYCMNYIEILEKIFSNSKKHEYILTNCYFQMANLYVEFDEISKAIELYQQCISMCNYQEEEHNNYSIKIFSFYNLSLIYYTTDQYILAKKMLETSLELNMKKNNDLDNEVSAIIYETLGEIELEYKKYGEALNFLSKALDLRKKFNNSEDNISLKKISFLINFIYDQYNYEEINFDNNGFQNNSFNNLILNHDINKNRNPALNQNNLGNTVNSNYNNIPTLNNFNNPSLLLSNNNLGNSILNKSNSLLNTKNFEYEKNTKIKDTSIFSKTNNSNINNNNLNNKPENSDEDDNDFNYNFTNFFKSNMHNLNETYKNLSLKVKPKDNEKSEEVLRSNISQTLREDEIEEVEKFFLFMTKLNEKEIEILNQDQKFTEINLPINFSDNFKACLSYSQKIQLLEMKILKLRRNIILKNPQGKIEIENLNFEILQRKNNSKKKVDNVLNRYANNFLLEKWVKNNINENDNLNNQDNFKRTNANRSDNLTKEESIIPGNDNFFNNNNWDFINNEFNLNQRELVMFKELKNALLNCISKNPEEGYTMYSDDEIVDIIRETTEEHIKYYIKNPERMLHNNESNENFSEGKSE